MFPLIRKFFFPVILPSVLVSFIQQALVVAVPLYVIATGGSLADAAFVITLKGIGMIVADVPAGMLLARLGERRVLQLATLMISAALMMMALSDNIMLIMLASFFMGLAHATWLVGRISFISEIAGVQERGRLISLTAGIIRMGNVVGPALAGGLIALAGYFSTFILFFIAALMAFVAVCLWVRPEKKESKPVRHVEHLVATVKSHARVLVTAGSAAVSLMLVRSSRALLLPLIGASLGLDAAEIGMVVSAGALIDMLLFYPAGSLMDRLGRKPVFITSLSIFGLALLLLPFSYNFISFMAVSLLMGVGNGISAGVIMTLGADLAPDENRGSFIGVWRLLSDIGTMSGPLLISSMLGFSTLSMACAGAGVIGLAGAVVVARFVKETNQHKFAEAD